MLFRSQRPVAPCDWRAGPCVGCRQAFGLFELCLSGGRGKRDILRIAARRTGNDLYNTRRLGTTYLKPLEWPLLALMLAFKRIPETLGVAKAASRRDHFKGSAYR